MVAGVHAAALELLAEHGYEQLRLADVASRAEVNKTTVYRRWPNKAALVADLLASFTRRAVATPDTGSLRGDLERLLGDIAATLDHPAVRAVLRGALTADADSDARRARADFWAERIRRSSVIVERAIARGEVAARTDPRSLLEMAAGPVYLRALFTLDPVDEQYLVELADRTVRAFA